jgi:hypothetical protein
MRPTIGSRDAPVAERCANCGTTLAGAYCHQCGQGAHLHRSLLHLTHEAVHDLLHFETRGWRTLPLLIVRPGLLTRRYIDGARKRYLAPLPLFLFAVVLLFFVSSLTGGSSTQKLSASDAASLRSQLAAEIARDRAEIARAGTQRGDDAAEQLAETRTDLAAAQAVQQVVERSTPQTQVHSAANQANITSLSTALAVLAAMPAHTGLPWLDATLHRQLSNPDLLLYKLRSAGSKFAFLLIPISLPFLWLMFVGRPAVTMYDHAVFSLYSLSFMALLFVGLMLLAAVGLGTIVPLLVLAVPPLHMFAQLRETYRLGVVAALWRTLALLCVAGTVFVIFLIFIAAVALH